MDKVLARVAQQVTTKPVLMTVEIIPRNKVEEWLQRYKLKSTTRTFKLYPITLGNLIRISELLLGMDGYTLGGNYLEKSYSLMKHHSTTVAHIVAVALHNQKSPPPVSLINFLKYQLTSKELMSVLEMVLNSMDVSSFMNAIISVRGLNVLDESKPASAISAEKTEVSPSTQAETIAPGISLAE